MVHKIHMRQPRDANRWLSMHGAYLSLASMALAVRLWSLKPRAWMAVIRPEATSRVAIALFSCVWQVVKGCGPGSWGYASGGQCLLGFASSQPGSQPTTPPVQRRYPLANPIWTPKGLKHTCSDTG